MSKSKWFVDACHTENGLKGIATSKIFFGVFRARRRHHNITIILIKEFSNEIYVNIIEIPFTFSRDHPIILVKIYLVLDRWFNGFMFIRIALTSNKTIQNKTVNKFSTSYYYRCLYQKDGPAPPGARLGARFSNNTTVLVCYPNYISYFQIFIYRQ